MILKVFSNLNNSIISTAEDASITEDKAYPGKENKYNILKLLFSLIISEKIQD